MAHLDRLRRGGSRRREPVRRLRGHRSHARDVQEQEDGEEVVSPKLLSDLAYLSSAILFIVGLKFLSHPRRARRGNQLAAMGMAFAIVASFIFIWGGHV
ncbi:MAG: NAD(P)(+) transhydrogenase (Re/Si-specific) subunit beta, partial [Candidatus Eisenbacteria bacterium]